MIRSMSRSAAMVMSLMVSVVCLQGAELKLNRYFTDNMVLQRGKPVTVRGVAEEGAEVTVSFAGQTKAGKADGEGNWAVTLDPIPASATPQKLTAVSSIGNRQSAISNVVVGDVFLHARQTSIDISLGRDEAGRKAAAATKPNPMFRTITIKSIPSGTPLNDLATEATTGWAVVDKAAALNMTASAYYLGRDLATASDVPIGIIDVNLGSAFANSWLSREALLETGKFYEDKEVASQVEKYEKMFEAEEQGVPFGKEKEPPKDTLKHPLFPAGGYNGTLYPLAGIGLKAVVVQLGNDYPYMRYQEILDSDNPLDREALNDAYGHVYDIRKTGFRMESKVVPRVMREWRKILGDGDLPFGLIVPPGSDLNTFAKHNCEMREMQRLVAEDTPNVSVILPGTEHIPLSAQPADEGLLGKRCINWIEGAVYKKPGIPATGPWFDRFEADFNEATIYFKEGTAKGLKAEGDALDYFEAANVEGDYCPVKAEIDGETIRLTSEAVTRIMRIRYNFSDHPDQGLVNAAALPAIPFRTARDEYEWFFRNEEDDLPEEYFLPAKEWKKNDVTLINVAALKNAGYDNFAGWIGPAGFKAGPFGPNMEVGEVKEGSPADGRILPGDVIHSANGRMLGNQAWLVMAEAITESETRDGKGKLVLGVRRGAENIDVELTLPVMGTYSSTAPYDCPKTEKIVANLEKWLAETGGSDTGRTGEDFLGTDSLFLLGAGDPEYQGLVRRAIYKKIADTKIVDDIDPTKGPKAWFPAWDSLLLGEYYMATGDRNVLPYLKFNCDLLAAKQHEAGAWRHNYPGGEGYGLMPALGMAAAIGFHLANDAGLDISQEAYQKVVKYYHDQAAMGRVIYGIYVSSSAPPEFEPEKTKNGLMSTYNGAVASSAILFKLEGDTRVAHLCSAISTYAFNNTYEGHGGNFWNNFWTPLGANVHGKKSFVNFWKNYRWYRELGRMDDGSLIGGGKISAGYGLPLVAPRQRLQITGAPASPFAADAPEILKPVLVAYWQKDYARAAKLANELTAGGTVGVEDLPTVEYLARAAKEMQESIDADLARMKTLIDAGDVSEAKTFLAGLLGVMPEGDERLVVMQKTLADVSEPPKKKDDKAADEPTEKPRQWECLVVDNQFKDPKKIQRERNGPVVTTKREKPNLWRMKVIEDMNQAPEGWLEPSFDDSGWLETETPISWRMYHTALLRTTFTVEDKKQFDALRLYAWVMRQQDIEIHLNGELIGKINNVGNAGDIENAFKDSALKHLKNGENTMAIKTRHNWRWGASFMRVYNDGFDFNLDARLKVE